MAKRMSSDSKFMKRKKRFEKEEMHILAEDAIDEIQYADIEDDVSSESFIETYFYTLLVELSDGAMSLEPEVRKMAELYCFDIVFVDEAVKEGMLANWDREMEAMEEDCGYPEDWNDDFFEDYYSLDSYSDVSIR